METPPTVSPPDNVDAELGSRGSRMRRVRLAVWAVLVAGLLGFIAFGSMSAISYTYYAYSGRLVRRTPQRSLIDIWSDAFAELPAFSLGWLPGAVMVACLAVTVLCVIAGAWMLLMQEPDTRRRSTRTG